MYHDKKQISLNLSRSWPSQPLPSLPNATTVSPRGSRFPTGLTPTATSLPAVTSITTKASFVRQATITLPVDFSCLLAAVGRYSPATGLGEESPLLGSGPLRDA